MFLSALIERDDAGAGRSPWRSCRGFVGRPSPADVTFVVDRSGSMEGSSIEEVRNALAALPALDVPGCRFNIVGFGDRFESPL